jgi:hypothetical protein
VYIEPYPLETNKVVLNNCHFTEFPSGISCPSCCGACARPFIISFVRSRVALSRAGGNPASPQPVVVKACTAPSRLEVKRRLLRLPTYKFVERFVLIWTFARTSPHTDTLRFNKIASVPDSVFRRLSNIRVLILSNNMFTSYPHAITHLKDVRGTLYQLLPSCFALSDTETDLAHSVMWASDARIFGHW